MDVNSEGINDDTIVGILNSLGGAGLKILLFEDIDTAFADKEKMSKEEKYVVQYDNVPQLSDTFEKTPTVPQALTTVNQKQTQSQAAQPKVVMQQQPTRKFLTYSGLLNAFDGVMSNQTGVITILTTNHIERLGDAFIRPGRVDAR